MMAQAFAVEPIADDIREFRQWKKRRDARLQRKVEQEQTQLKARLNRE